MPETIAGRRRKTAVGSAARRSRRGWIKLAALQQESRRDGYRCSGLRRDRSADPATAPRHRSQRIARLAERLPGRWRRTGRQVAAGRAGARWRGHRSRRAGPGPAGSAGATEPGRAGRSGARLRTPAARGRPTAAPACRGDGRLVPWVPRRLRPGRRRGACAVVGGGAGGIARPGHGGRVVVRFWQRERRRGCPDRGARIRAHGRDAAVHRMQRRRCFPRRYRALIPDAAGLAGLAIAPDEYARRRRQLMQMAGPDAALLVAAAPERMRNADAAWPYRQDSDFHYLAGFPEPDAVLALLPGRRHGEVVLFCRERDAEHARWHGPSVGTGQAVAAWGMDDAFPIEDIDDILPGMIEGRSRVYCHFGHEPAFDAQLLGWMRRLRQSRGGGVVPKEFVALGHLLHDLRLFKSRAELKLMRASAAIAVE